MTRCIGGLRAVVLAICAISGSYGQEIDGSVEPFRRISWGMTPQGVSRAIGVSWLRDRSGLRTPMETGLRDVFQRQCSLQVFGYNVEGRFQFSNGDSGLAAVIIVLTSSVSIPGFPDAQMPEIPDESLDSIWNITVARFGEEDQGGKTIPLVGKSKKWLLPGKEVRVGRISIPFDAVMLGYIRR